MHAGFIQAGMAPLISNDGLFTFYPSHFDVWHTGQLIHKLYIYQGRSYIQAIEAYASLNKLKSKPSTQIMVLM